MQNNVDLLQQFRAETFSDNYVQVLFASMWMSLMFYIESISECIMFAGQIGIPLSNLSLKGYFFNN